MAVACHPAELPPNPDCPGQGGVPVALPVAAPPPPPPPPLAQPVEYVSQTQPVPVAHLVYDQQGGALPTAPPPATVVIGQPVVGQPVAMHAVPVNVQQGGATRVSQAQINPHESDYQQGFWISFLVWLCSGCPLGPLFIYLCCKTEGGLVGSFNGSGMFGVCVSVLFVFLGMRLLAVNSACECNADGLFCRRSDEEYHGPNAETSCENSRSHQTSVGAVLLVLGVLVMPIAAVFFWKGEQKRKMLGVNFCPCSANRR
eukprot:TRINITY_DN1851_c2_g1_i2.p1 TRINITY_DN1851_c2_g1~~TRINITY_DN1851_c2_g1_i2.p1  ORF type:complete len:257 (+),score=2.84 TRINITY_DN1851_c2_g1_i2:79-849(+)